MDYSWHLTARVSSSCSIRTRERRDVMGMYATQKLVKLWYRRLGCNCSSRLRLQTSLFKAAPPPCLGIPTAKTLTPSRHACVGSIARILPDPSYPRALVVIVTPRVVITRPTIKTAEGRCDYWLPLPPPPPAYPAVVTCNALLHGVVSLPCHLLRAERNHSTNRPDSQVSYSTRTSSSIICFFVFFVEYLKTTESDVGAWQRSNTK